MSTDPAMSIVPPYTPELLLDVQDYICHHFAHVCPWPWRVLELGAGWSTLWFATLGCHVTSVEHDWEWHREVCNALFNSRNIATLIFGHPCKELIDELTKCEGWEPWNLILVDCVDEARNECVAASIPHMAPGGLLVLDDSHWEMLQPSVDLLKAEGFRCLTLSGFHVRKTGERKYHQTSIYWRG